MAAPATTQQLQALRQALTEQFTAELARRDDRIEALTSELQNRSGSKPKRQLPDPPKFDGTQLHYDTWLAQLQLVLTVDGAAIGDAQAQFAYVYLRLDSGPAALCLETLKHANLTDSYNYQKIIDLLDRHNGVENKVQRAKAKLHKLNQSASFHGFLVSFEVTLGEAGGWQWDDDRKIDTLRNSLSDFLKRKMQEHDVSGTVPTTYVDFVALCKRYVSQSNFTPSTIHSGSNAPKPSSGYPPNRTLYDPKADQMDISEIAQINTLDFADPPRSPSAASSVVSIDRTSKCHRCGSNDHYVSVCPRPRSKSPADLIPNTVCINSINRMMPQPDGIQLQDLIREVEIMGIDKVLDTLLTYRYDNNIDSEDEGVN